MKSKELKTMSTSSVALSQVNASLALSDRMAFGVYTNEPNGLKADGTIKEALIEWVLQPVFDAQNRLTFFRLSYIETKGKDKGSFIESARLQPSKTTGFSVTFQNARNSTVRAIASFTSLDKATDLVQSNVLPPSFFQLAFVYANVSQSELKDMDSVKNLTAASPELWNAAIESGNRLLPQFFKAIQPATVEQPATQPAKPAIATPTETTEQPATVEQPATQPAKPAIAITNGKTAK